MSLCQYKDVFGKPGTDIHSYRVGDIAIVDFLLTIAAAFILCKIFDWSFWVTLLVLFVVGIIMHRLFCVRTTIDKLLFPSC